MPARGTTSHRKQFWLGLYTWAAEECGSDATQEDVIAWVAARPELWKHRGYDAPPADSTAKAYLTELRKSEDRDWLDEPWSIGQLTAHAVGRIDLPAKALPDVLDLWRRLLIGGKRLTNRQALWAARLRHLIPPEDKGSEERRLGLLYAFAVQYSVVERIAGPNSAPDTAALDAMLAFRIASRDPADESISNATAYLIAQRLGLVPAEPSGGGDIDDPWREYKTDSREVEELKTAIGLSGSNGGPLADMLVLAIRALAATDVWRNGSVAERDRLANRFRDAATAGNWDQVSKLIEISGE